MILNPILPIVLIILIVIGCLIFIFMSSKGVKLVVRLLILIVLCITALRPMLPNGSVEVAHANLDVIFVVDNSLSMDAVDYDGTNKRLDGVKKDIKYIVDKIPSANYSLISWDYDGRIRVPLTFDTNTFNAALMAVNPPTKYSAKGSKLTGFKDVLKVMLTNSSKKKDRMRIVFVMTDGENTTEDKLERLGDLKGLISEGAILGYGTTQGANIYYKDYEGKLTKIQDQRKYPYVDVVSKLDESNLKNMAHDMGIDYIHMDKTNRIDNKINDVLKFKENNETVISQSYKDIYYYFTPILIILFSIELFMDRRSEM